MKRYIALFFAILFLFSACTPSVSQSPSPSVTQPAASASEQPTPSTDPSAEDELPGNPIVFEGTPDAFKDMDGLEFVADMGAGWNLGNTMDADGVGLGAETAWGNPKTTKEMIQLLADSGFKTLRIPTTYSKHSLSKAPYTINTEWLDRVQEIVDYGMDAGLYVIINMHHETDWQFPDAANMQPAADRIEACWKQIGARFGGYSEKLIFETMNEPRLAGTKDEWNGGTSEARSVINYWNKQAVAAIRSTGGNNGKRFIMCPTIAAAPDNNPVSDFKMPGGGNIIVSLHAYKPYNLALNVANKTANKFDDPSEIDRVFDTVKKNFIDKGIPVVLGETGCLNKDNTEERVKWAAYYAGKFASIGVPCVWWDNGAFSSSGGGESFGLMDRKAVEWKFPEIVDAWVGAYN